MVSTFFFFKCLQFLWPEHFPPPPPCKQLHIRCSFPFCSPSFLQHQTDVMPGLRRMSQPWAPCFCPCMEVQHNRPGCLQADIFPHVPSRGACLLLLSGDTGQGTESFTGSVTVIRDTMQNGEKYKHSLAFYPQEGQAAELNSTSKLICLCLPVR